MDSTKKAEESGVSERSGVKPAENEAGAAKRRYAAADGGSGFHAAVPVRSMWPAVLIIRGTPSGGEYRWDGPGAVLMVAAQDVEHLRTYNHGGERACCGGGPRVYFEFPGGKA